MLACLDFPLIHNDSIIHKEVDCWQAPFSKMAMLKIKEGVIKSSFFIFVHPFKLSTQPLTITTLKLAIQLKYHQKNF